MFQYIKRLWDFGVQLIYPRRCPVCDNIVVPFGKKVCTACYRKLRYIKQPVCMKCGKELRTTEKEYCGDCSRIHHVYKQGRAVFPYEIIAPSLYRFKYAGKREYAAFYGEQALCLLGEDIRIWDPQAIVPVPIHPKRWRKRGYNQATEFAKALGRQMKIPVRSHLVQRVKNTVPMKILGPEERQNNLKKAFHIWRNDVKLERVLIVDDIYTTGSTMDAMAEELQRHGVSDIYFVTIAVGNGV